MKVGLDMGCVDQRYPARIDNNQPGPVAQALFQSRTERRVRLGLLLAEIGAKGEVEITDQEMGQAIMAQAKQYPGQEREYFDFVKQNRQALEQLRAPIFEDKVVDLVLSKAKITELAVKKADFEKELAALDED